VPVIARGDEFIFAQDFAAVAAFVGLEYEASRLPPAALVAKLDLVLGAAQRYARQIPQAEIGGKLPGRDRSYLQLCYHVFEVAAAFLTAARGARLEHAMIVGPLPDGLASGADAADFGQRVRDDLAAWWGQNDDPDLAGQLDTYYGPQSSHALLERTAWHAAQHCRQLLMVLEQLGLAADGPLSAQDLAGLPLPEKVWDDEAAQ
jgi:hypothetical protein